MASGAGTSGARAAAHLTVARCAFHQGDTPGVQYHVTAALPTLQANADAYSEGFALMILGTAIGRAGNADHGLALLHGALDLAKSHRLAWLQSCTLAYLGMVLSIQGRHVQARQALEEGLRGVRELGDSRLIGWFLISLGRSALGAKQPDQARRRFADALTWERRLADAWGEAWALQGLASAAIQDHDLRTGVDLLLQSLAPAQRAHSKSTIAGALRLLATVATLEGRPHLAVELLSAATVLSNRPADWSVDTDGLDSPEPAKLIATLGNGTFAEHWARGRAMTTHEAIDASQLGQGSSARRREPSRSRALMMSWAGDMELRVRSRSSIRRRRPSNPIGFRDCFFHRHRRVDTEGGRDRRREVAGTPRRAPRCRASGTRSIPRQRDRHSRGWLPGHVRRARPRGPMRRRDRVLPAGAWARGPGGRSHGRGRVARRPHRRNRRPYRSPRRGHRRAG